MRAKLITIKGLVQGIGFRPFVYSVAQTAGVTGWVKNSAAGVRIHAQGSTEAMAQFCRLLQEKSPVLSRIDSLTVAAVASGNFCAFTIAPSEDHSGVVTEISPDIAVCASCLTDMHTQEHRVDYSFVNCTLCGPRYSIIQALPYDRPNTTMAPFTMCVRCSSEYSNPANRRFHAQPIACVHCGPVYTMHTPTAVLHSIGEVVAAAAALLEQGGVLAIKGVGGFHLAADPCNTNAVDKLRMLKKRDKKPFALMFRDRAALAAYAYVNEEEWELLESIVRPIVLLRDRGLLPRSINQGLATLGAFLPYMPFHYQLFTATKLSMLIMTSGNSADEPMVIDNEQALALFNGKTNGTITYNRTIHQRIDDSVAAVYNSKARLFRRSRGFVPSPIQLAFAVDGLVATGAEQKCCFAFGKGLSAIFGQHIGDLKNSETYQFYQEAFSRLGALYRLRPTTVAHDMHPDYLSTLFAQKMGIPTVAVQHHHAHIASCCAEHGLHGKVLGVAFDGTGFGDDGTVWGGEFLLADYTSYTRVSHLRGVGMPGGDRVAREPWRMAAAYLYDTFGSALPEISASYFPGRSSQELALLHHALRQGIGTPVTSSAGRLFDAVAALCNLGESVSFEAEAAMRLEALCGDINSVKPYPWRGGSEIDLRPLIEELCFERSHAVSAAISATRFHATITEIIVKTCLEIRDEYKIDTVVLSGGCFQNRIIFENIAKYLKKEEFKVYTHELVPCNDGGIALGQLAVAAHIKGG